MLLSIKEEISQNQAQCLVEQAQGWPGFSIGYFNQSIQGWQRIGNNEIYFDQGDRFDGFQLGLKIPLYRNLVQSGVKSAKIGIAIAEQNFTETERQLLIRLNELKLRMKTNGNKLNWYNTKGKDYARTIAEDASLRLRNGDLDYLQWTILMVKSIETQLQYIESLLIYREAYIHYQSLTGKI